jgi:hypothetical protein
VENHCPVAKLAQADASGYEVVIEVIKNEYHIKFYRRNGNVNAFEVVVNKLIGRKLLNGPFLPTMIRKWRWQSLGNAVELDIDTIIR